MTTKIQRTDGTTVTISDAMGRALTGALELAEKHVSEGYQVLDEGGEYRRSIGWPTKHALVKRGLAYYKELRNYTVTILNEDGIRAAKQLAAPQTDEPKQTPYDVDHVHIIHEPGSITALYIYDPEKAKDPRATYYAPGFKAMDEYMVIAEASRFYKTCGADFSGWIVRTPLDGNYSTEVIPNRKKALESVWDEVKDHFNR